MSARCARAWEVEAARLGQLRGAQLEAHREHLASGCVSCTREAAALQELARWLRAPDVVPDEIALRRLRRQTLARAQAIVAGHDGPARSRARALRALSFALGCGTTLIVWSLASAGEPVVPPAPVAPTLQVVAASAPAPQQAGVSELPAPERVPARSVHAQHPVRHVRAHVAPGAPPISAPIDEAQQRSEDAAYLRVLRSWRACDMTGAQLAAADYLARYPDGFRRIEVEQLRSRISVAEWGTVGAPRQNAPSPWSDAYCR